MAPLKMYDLAGSDDACRFSPFFWRARFTLAHKQPLLASAEPLYADDIVCAVFQWIRKVGDDDTLGRADPLKRWCSEVLQRFERNLADCRQAP